jgi:RNA polymerase sigma-70 factor (sigma-E family)
VRLTSKASDARAAVDPEDFPTFVAAQGAQLYRTACLLTGGDTHLAEDLVQETLGRVYAKWGQRRRIENPAGYAQTTLVHAFISMRRRKSSSERPAAHLRDTPVDAADIELRVTLLDALTRLTELDRAVLVLRFWEDRSVQETAAALKLSSGAVRSRCLRALARLREQLGAEFIEFAGNATDKGPR